MVDDQDRQTLMLALRDSGRLHGTQVHAYRIRHDELQLLLTPSTPDGLSQTLQGVGRRYAAAFNRRHGRSGALWDGRFRAAVIEPGPPRLWSLLAVDAESEPGATAEGGAAGVSSSAHRLGGRRDDMLVDPPEYWQLGNTPFERELAYRALLREGVPPDLDRQLRQAVLSGRPFGSAHFIAEVARLAGRPVTVRPRGRPRLSAG